MDAYEWQEAAERWTVTDRMEPAGASARRVIARAQGPVIHDTQGRRYLDFGAIPTGAILGHNHPRYVSAIKQGLQAVGDDAFLDVDGLRLHRRLGEILTPPLQKSILVAQGDALRVATDIARAVTGAADMMHVCPAPDGTLRFAYPATATVPDLSRPPRAPGPGMYPYRAAAAGAPPRGCPDPAQCACGTAGEAYACPELAFDAALRACGERPAGLIMAPFAGGAFGASSGCARLLRRLCHQNGMLLAVDESATGYGRTGRMWGHQHDDMVPDILIVSARFGAGLSIAAVCMPPDIAERAAASDCLAMDVGWHDPVACTAAVTTIDIVQDEDLVSRAAAIGEHLKMRLGAMAADKPLIRTIYGRGTMFTIELAAGGEPGPSARTLVRTAVRACRDKGLLLRGADAAGGALQLAPPMVATATQIDEGLDILDQVLRGMSDTLGARAASSQGALQPGQHQLAQ
ncbi:Aspartate aminotransferase family protein [Bordetella sputigena]|uniref:aminotransferase class III-fold pyridoxal phosphate-dependent enzyme n=1 Tax=Bordetella sputigena TaxID=1416810 RepID=UPI0039EFAA6E